MKKVTTIILTLAMIMSFSALVAFAEDEAIEDDTILTEEEAAPVETLETDEEEILTGFVKIDGILSRANTEKCGQFSLSIFCISSSVIYSTPFFEINVFVLPNAVIHRRAKCR